MTRLVRMCGWVCAAAGAAIACVVALWVFAAALIWLAVIALMARELVSLLRGVVTR